MQGLKEGAKVAVFSRRMARLPHFKELSGASTITVRPGDSAAGEIDLVIGWGDKVYAQKAKAYALRHSLPYWALEDGFLRSIRLGSSGAPPLSLSFDDVGVYYDARVPSRLEQIFEGTRIDLHSKNEDPLLNTALLKRASLCREQIVQAGLTKYNNAPCAPAILGTLPEKFVLVVDQTVGDSSIAGGLGDASTFEKMLRAALEEEPQLSVVVKLHPEVIAGKKQGHLASAKQFSPRIILLGVDIAPDDLFPRVKKVFVCSSQLGFDALLREIPVVCFGVPFYAGWGLTDDRNTVPRRGRKLSLDQLTAGALLLYPRYIHPESKVRCAAEDVIEHLALQRETFRKNSGTWYCLGFSRWKHKFVRQFLSSPGNDIHFIDSPKKLPSTQSSKLFHVLVWGEKGTKLMMETSRDLKEPPAQMEDGLLRSVGLGSDLHTPYSLVVDKLGVYYDPRRPSELEQILAKREFSDLDRERGRKLREKIVRTRVTKYNLHSTREDLLGIAGTSKTAQKLILVPGQVEDDASIQLGCPGVRTNKELLVAVRKANPEARLIFKPHPDVVSGNRRGRVSEEELEQLCDQVVTSSSLADCLEIVDEVHTMTSLVGFEALLRGLQVTTYGQPFYSGWSLTSDQESVPRRKRQLHLDELVYATYVLYPHYFNYELGCFTTPEWVVDQLAGGIETSPTSARLALPRIIRQTRRLVRAIKLSLNVPRS